MQWIDRKLIGWIVVLLVLVPAANTLAQDDAALEIAALPEAFSLQGVRHEYQSWNNCGPATITNALTYFGYTANQKPAADWLKPNYDDKNVSPWQMVEFVNTQVPGTTKALTRVDGDLEQLKTLLYNGFPVVIEEGYDPPPHDLGWMGHYLLISGYDDNQGMFITQDSYIGPNIRYTYEHVNQFWRHFNRTYIVLYDMLREEELRALLGDDADEFQNTISALTTARDEAIVDPEDPFAWFNMGTSFVKLGMYQEAATAYDQARNVGGGLPWRMLWYQFGPYEAYNAVGRYGDTISLAQSALNDGGGHFVEETFYYAGVAREGLGDSDRALVNYNTALDFNPNFHPAEIARSNLLAVASAG